MSIPETKDKVKLHSRRTKENAKRNQFQSKYFIIIAKSLSSSFGVIVPFMVQKVKVKFVSLFLLSV